MEADPIAAFADGQRRRRRRRLAVIGGALVVASVGAAVLAWRATRPASTALPPIARPLLWVVELDGATSHLFGTLHLGYRLADLPPPVTAAQDRARVTIVEADLLRPATPSAPREKAARPERLADADWRALARRADRPVAELTTWDTSALVGLAITTSMPRIEPMDRALQRRARDRGQPVVTLMEASARAADPAPDPADPGVALASADGATATDPAAAVVTAAFDDPALLDELRRVVRRPELLRRQLRATAVRYATGADDACAAAAGELVGGLNQAWAPVVEAELRRGGAFVAIGCAHLPGFVAYLQLRGFTVRRADAAAAAR